MPSQRLHSSRLVVPTVTLFIATWQRGHREASAPGASLRLPFAPQCEQNFAPANITPKHVGQVTVARVALQKSQRVAADETAGPQDGHRSVSAGGARPLGSVLCHM